MIDRKGEERRREVEGRGGGGGGRVEREGK